MKLFFLSFNTNFIYQKLVYCIFVTLWFWRFDGFVKIECEGSQTVNIPFKFQSFQYGRPGDERFGDYHPQYGKIEAREIQIIILDSRGHSVCTMKVTTFREAKFKTLLRIGFFLDFRNFIFASSAGRIKKYL